jgi:hypothetical protein
MKSSFDYTEAASFVGNKKETLSMAVELGSDTTWTVIQLSPRRFALFVEESTYIIPQHATVVRTNIDNQYK